ncbi:alpha/beta fold hydrolase [Terrarubrum flagellatum]|uniref:alpha/beta fold hydrolase n=1 Tax=Terrirubrum flagellatum TaxID=2895980 RepID=UPI00314553B8
MDAGSVRRTRAAALERPKARCLYSGSEAHPIFVDSLPAAPSTRRKTPVVMIHGGGHTGACYLATPDGRAGWAEHFAASGRDVFIPDWPGHGRSPMSPDFATLSTRDIAESLMVLLEEIGSAVLVAHSAAGPMAWWIAEQKPHLVAAIVGLAPGPPANLLPDLPADPAAIHALRDDESLGCPVYAPENAPVWLPVDFMRDFWANAPRFPKHAFEIYRRSIVPESARVLNERFNIGGRGLKVADPKSLRAFDILIMTGDHDPRHPRALDQATAEALGAEFLFLPDIGVSGNGHLLMIEDNSAELAGLAIDWLDRKGC